MGAPTRILSSSASGASLASAAPSNISSLNESTGSSLELSPELAKLAIAFNDGVTEVLSAQASQVAGLPLSPCNGSAVVLTKSSQVSPNDGCAMQLPTLSCSCISQPAGSNEWVFRLKARPRTPVTAAVPTVIDPSETIEVNTIGRFSLPSDITTLRLIGSSSSKAPQTFVFDLASVVDGESSFSLIQTQDKNHVTEVEIANIDMSGVLISDTFLPPSVSVFTARNCNLTVLPSPNLWFRGTKLLSLDLSDNKLSTWYDDETPGIPRGLALSVSSVNLAGNGFTWIPSALASVTGLTHLNLSNNPVTNLTVSEALYTKLSGLQSFSLDHASASDSKRCRDGTTPRTTHNVRLCVVSTRSSTHKTLVFVAVAGGIVILVLLIALVVVNKKRRQELREKALSQTQDGHSFRSIQRGVAYNASHASSSTSMRLSVALADAAFINSSLFDNALLVKSRLNHNEIRIQKPLKQGAYGLVYSGTYQGRAIALKMLHHDISSDARQVESFVKEIILMASLSHPRIVEYIGCVWDTVQDLTVVTELMDRGDLREVLQHYKKRNSPLTWASHKTRLALHIAEGLEYLHTLNPKVIHRDLKSKNVLVNHDLDAKLTDFGISREGRFEQTHMTAGVGTSFWIAPEVLAGLRYDERADIFSFGVVLSEIDTDDYPYWNDKENQAAGEGTKPASDQTRIDIILRLVVAEHLRPRFAPNCPAPIRALAERCLQADPSSRPSAGEIVQFLSALLQRPSLKTQLH